MPSPRIVGLARLDQEQLVSAAGLQVRWAELGLPAPGDGRTFRAVFGRADETFRRLDRVSRALVLAGEAAGLARVIPRAFAASTGLSFETVLGCLDADLRFADSMAAGMCDGPVFAYTLPSTCLGELALRHGLRGPTVCTATEPSQRGLGLQVAAQLLATGEADFVVAGHVDVLAIARPGVEPQCAVVVAVLAAATSELPAVAAWPGVGPDAYERLASALSGSRSPRS